MASTVTRESYLNSCCSPFSLKRLNIQMCLFETTPRRTNLIQMFVLTVLCVNSITHNFFLPEYGKMPFIFARVAFSPSINHCWLTHTTPAPDAQSTINQIQNSVLAILVFHICYLRCSRCCHCRRCCVREYVSLSRGMVFFLLGVQQQK